MKTFLRMMLLLAASSAVACSSAPADEQDLTKAPEPTAGAAQSEADHLEPHVAPELFVCPVRCPPTDACFNKGSKEFPHWVCLPL